MTNPFTVSDEEFVQYLNDTLDVAQKLVVEGDFSAYIPSAHIYGVNADGEQELFHCVLTDFDMDRRYEIIAGLGMKFAADGIAARCMFFMSEAWFSTQEHTPGGKPMMPRDDPKRKEIIQCGGIAADGRTILARFEVTRTKDDCMRLVKGSREVIAPGDGMTLQNNIGLAFYRGQAMVFQARAA